MTPLPDRLNLDHLKKQAKQLIRLYRSRDPAAMARFRSTLPEAAGLSDEGLSSHGLRLHDAQSCVAREHGFASWPDLKRYVEVQAVAREARAVRILRWLQLIYRGDVSSTSGRANLRVGLRMLAEDPGLVAGDPYLACAIGVGFGGVYVDTGLNGCLQQRMVETRRGMRLRTVNVCAY